MQRTTTPVRDRLPPSVRAVTTALAQRVGTALRPQALDRRDRSSRDARRPGEAATQAFYDRYWPANVPDARATRAHIHRLLPTRGVGRALDAGCGTGVCTVALAERAAHVTGLDVSAGSLATARRVAQGAGRGTITFCQGSLLALPFAAAAFDLVLSWGVVHHTADPERALDELVRVLRPGGTLVLAVYRKTWLTPLHEAIRRVCRALPRGTRPAIIWSIAALVRLVELAGARDRVRPDNASIAAQVEDWYFVPEKHFFTIAEMQARLAARGLTSELLCAKTGRLRSSSNFILRAAKQG